MILKLKNKLIIKISLILLTISVYSCSSIYLKHSGVLDEKPKIETLTNNNKKVLFLPIHHIGKPEYFEDISKKVDSLNQLNCITFFEDVTTKLNDSTEIIMVAKKFRKIQGSFDAKNGYLDTINNTANGNIKIDKKHRLINQPKFDELNVDTLTSKNADVTLEMMISKFEAKNGVIKLNECDIKTHLDSVYKCETLGKKIKKEFRENYIQDFRNQNLAQIINKSNSNKILVIFGSGHLEGLVSELKKIDSKWMLKK